MGGGSGTGTDAPAISPFPVVLSQRSRYLLVLATLCAATALRFALFPASAGFIYITYAPGVVLVALLAGLRPALAYTGVSALAGIVLFHPPHATPTHVADLIPMAQFFGNGAAIAFAIHYYQRWVVSQHRELRASLDDLSHTQAQLRRAFDETPVGIAHTTPDGRWLRCNPRLLHMLGYDERELLGRHYVHFTHPDDLQDTVQRRTRLLDGLVDGYQVEKRYRRKDGRWLWAAVTLSVARDPGGAPSYLISTVEDIGERREAQEKLRQSEARTLAIIRSASDGIVSTDGEGRVTLFNPAAEHLFGVGAASMLGRPLDALLPPEARAMHPGMMKRFAGSGVSQREMGAGRVAAVHADGRRMEIEASISQVTIDGSVILTAMLRDVTERTRAERRLVAYQLELAGLNRRLLEQEKETTRRLAQTLHDELGQTLAALRMQFDVLRQRGHVAAVAATAADEGQPTAGLQRIGMLITQANRQVRDALTELRPPLLDELGLAAALDNELRRQSDAGIGPGLSLVVDPGLRDCRWPGDVEFAAFMVAREAIYNAIRHAGATAVEVVLEGDAGTLDVWVDDDGIGLPEEPLRARPGHLGLVGMRERAGSIGAQLELGSTQAQGTRIHLSWHANYDPAPGEP